MKQIVRYYPTTLGTLQVTQTDSWITEVFLHYDTP